MKPMHFALIALIIRDTEVGSEWAPAHYKSLNIPMVWVDGRYRSNTPVEVDTFFDRLVSIYYIDETSNDKHCFHQVTGVIITTQLILTSFNGMRTLLLKSENMKDMDIYWFNGRELNPEGRTLYYSRKGDPPIIKCARQVIPSTTRPIDMRHGRNSPLHDLIVIGVEEKINFTSPIPPALNEFADYRNWRFANNRYIKHDFTPIRTILAKPDDKMFIDEMKFASIGHLNDEHIKENRYLETGKFGDFVDCDEWLPWEWGHFICLDNTENYPGLASGAMLFSDTKLFGVGSFMLRKKGRSILVFTDVRPYWHLLHRTCTDDDQNLRVPDDIKAKTKAGIH